jgi:hypothetical protein
MEPVRVVRRRAYVRFREEDEEGEGEAEDRVGVVSEVLVVGESGRRVMVVGRWPPREKVVRWRRSWPWTDFGSRGCQSFIYSIIS